MDRVDAIVIGAGAVGLAIARRLALSGREVIVLERADAIGTETSARNSEVIHAGMYYPTGSLKARLCVAGRHLLYDYCAEKGIGHKRIGKLIVATDEAEHQALYAIADRADANGLTGADRLQRLNADEVRAMEPEIRASAGLFSPSTGIIDSHDLMLNYQGDLEAKGGVIAFETEFTGADVTPDGFVVRTLGLDGTEMELAATVLVNSAGLHASTAALGIEGLDLAHVRPTFYSRGCYFSLNGASPFKHLVYPVPPAASLGIHLTLDLGGQAKFGPDHDWVDAIDYHVDPARAESFYAAIEVYYPGIRNRVLTPSYAGIRPKVERPGGANTDFVLDGPSAHGIPGLLNLFGIESPGLTSSLALAEAAILRLGLEA